MTQNDSLPPVEGPEYTPCACGHIEPEHAPNAGDCYSCDCGAYQPAAVAPPADRAGVAGVRALHQQYAFGDDPQDYCAHCNQITGSWIPWPCPTIRALDAAALPAPDQQAAEIRAAALLEAARVADALPRPEHYQHTLGEVWEEGAHDAAAELRRLAGETQQDRKSTAKKAADLGLTDTEYRAQSHAAAVATIRAAIPGMYAHVGFRLEDVLKEADEAQQDPAPGGETEAHPPSHAWTVESPRRDHWASWGATYDDRDWAVESYESATTTAPHRPFRIVRATTTYTVETEHAPAAPARSGQPDTNQET